MRNLIAATAAAILLPAMASAGGLTPENPPWMEPPVYVPPQASFSWGGAYAGLSYGRSSHRNTYTRSWEETEHFREETPWEREVIDREEIPWERHDYSCNRGPNNNNHSRFKCDITGLTHSPELAALDSINSPWNNARNQDIRYRSGYDGLWMGASDSFAFTLPSYVAPVTRGSKFGSVAYAFSEGVDVIETTRIETGVDVREWSETTQYSEDYTVTESDTTYGGFVGYRHQFQSVPFVVGAEANFMTTDNNGDFAQFGLQAGFAMDRVLPYIEVGADHYAGGVDIALGQQGNLLIGVRTWESHDGDDSGQMIRVGWQF